MAKRSKFVFGASPAVRYNRTRFDLSHEVKTSMSVGKLYPIDITEVLPGDTFKFSANALARISTAFLRPVMDNCYLDVYAFYVPNRILYDRFEETMGENKQSAWAELNPPDMPVISNSSNVYSGSVGDYLGLPVKDVIGNNTLPPGINILPFRGFAMIYDQWFRNENTVDPMLIQKGDFKTSESLNGAPWSPSNYTGQLPYVGKRKDYFTSCLPSPQKGSPVELSLGDTAPVSGTFSGSVPTNTLRFVGTPTIPGFQPTITDINNNPFSNVNLHLDSSGHFSAGGQATGSSTAAFLKFSNQSFNIGGGINAVADLSQATAMNVNDLRFAFQLQKMLEKDARFGTRYREYLLGHFGVSNPDARMQVPEFLGGKRIPINVQEVAQTNTQQETSAGVVESPLGTLGATSVSALRSRFSKSFTEHGYLYVVACIRVNHTYQQGINKMWQRKSRNDLYDPLFASLGEQPVYRSEIFGSESANPQGLKSNVFGYNEAWAEYRYKPNIVTGQMRSAIENSLDIWHFADLYSNAPVLSEQFTNETPTYFDRTVAVPSQSQDNFIVDFYFNVDAFRVLPAYSVPGLIDHH